jgi:hypothetical protein
VVVDVQGYVTATGARLTPPDTARVLDTRSAGGPRPGGAVVEVPPGAPDGAAGAITNLAVVAPSSMGYVTADACPQTTPGAQTRSNLNHARLETVSNLSLVPAADRTFCLVPSATTDVLVDVQGWLVDGGEWGIDLVPATRLVDTRGCWAAGCAVAVPAGGLLRLAAPAGAAGVLANLTVTAPASGGFLTAGPCDEVGRLGWSNANFDRGETTANLALVRTGADGTFCVRPSTATHVIVDLAATVSPGGGSGLTPVSPSRVVDTRVR